MLDINIQPLAWDHLGWWAKNNPRTLLKIHELISISTRTPFEGLGKPEPLKHHHKGYWSRRINQEHRLVYKVENKRIVVISVKGHY